MTAVVVVGVDDGTVRRLAVGALATFVLVVVWLRGLRRVSSWGDSAE